MEGRFCLLGMLEVPEVMRCVLGALYAMGEAGWCRSDNALALAPCAFLTAPRPALATLGGPQKQERNHRSKFVTSPTHERYSAGILIVYIMGDEAHF